MTERCNLCGGNKNSKLHQDYTHWVRTIYIHSYICIAIATVANYATCACVSMQGSYVVNSTLTSYITYLQIYIYFNISI